MASLIPGMDNLYSPVRYEQLSELDLQEHLRYSANKFQHGDRLDVFLCQAGVLVPFVKHVYRRRPATLDVLLRSGSIGRDKLSELHELLSARAYDVRTTSTSKKKLLQRVMVRLPIDGTIALTGAQVLQEVNEGLGFKWPTSIAIGYEFGTQAPELPGRVSFRDPVFNVGYQVGNAAGKFLKKILR